jgi:hypothetical protein
MRVHIVKALGIAGLSGAFVICGPLSAQAYKSDTDYSVMNATYDRIWVDVDSTAEHDWRDLPLDPSQSAGFDGELAHLKVRLSSGKILQFDQQRIREIRRRSKLKKGDWIVDMSGLRFVSLPVRQKIFKRLCKPLALTNRWSQPLAVAINTFDFMKQFLIFAALAAASGGSALSR